MRNTISYFGLFIKEAETRNNLVYGIMATNLVFCLLISLFIYLASYIFGGMSLPKSIKTSYIISSILIISICFLMPMRINLIKCFSEFSQPRRRIFILAFFILFIITFIISFFLLILPDINFYFLFACVFGVSALGTCVVGIRSFNYRITYH
jgi:hypothetical protein